MGAPLPHLAARSVDAYGRCRLPNRDAVAPVAEAISALAAPRNVKCVQLDCRR
jgi:hypothetical protein